MLDPRDLIRSTALEVGLDPYVALAVAQQESGIGRNVYGDVDDPGDGIDPRSVRGPDGRWYTSLGPFQERVVGGAGETHLRRGGSLADLFDPVSATRRFADRYQNAASSMSYIGATPGTIAAAAQRPADRAGYASSVDAHYDRLRREAAAGVTPPPATSSSECPPGYKKNLFGMCMPEGGFIPLPEFPNPFENAPKDYGGGPATPETPSGAVPNPGEIKPPDIPGAIMAVGERIAGGAQAIAIGTAVLAAVAVLGYGGVKRILG